MMHRDIALRFIEEAKTDLSVFEKLKGDNLLRRRSLFSLQQACEKALKAYFILAFIDFLDSLSELSGPEDTKVYRKEYALLKRSKQFRPKNTFGHTFREFYKYMDTFSRELVYGKMRRYLMHLLRKSRSRLKAKKKEIIARLMKESNIDLGKADSLFSLMLGVVSIVIDYIKRYEYAYKPIKFEKFELEAPPCILTTSEIYWKITRAIDAKIDELSKLDVLPSIHISLETLFKSFPAIKRLLEPKIIPEASSYCRSLLSPVFALPLHLCLLRYEQGSRYPDSLQPSEEEMKSIDEASKIVQQLVKTVENLTYFLPSD